MQRKDISLHWVYECMYKTGTEPTATFFTLLSKKPF